MKSNLISNTVEKEFKPFKLELTVETVEEARLFYHVFNHTNLASKIGETWYSTGFDYEKSKGTLSGTFIGEKISKEIRNQGYKV